MTRVKTAPIKWGGPIPLHEEPTGAKYDDRIHWIGGSTPTLSLRYDLAVAVHKSGMFLKPTSEIIRRGIDSREGAYWFLTLDYAWGTQIYPIFARRQAHYRLIYSKV